MSRTFATAKLFSAAVTKAIRSRPFSSSAAAAASTTVKKAPISAAASMVKKTGEEGKQSWIPDPRTGFYRPEHVAEEIDPAELRALLLKKH